MFETYDTNLKAYVERTGQYYDLQQKAWVDVPSAMTYDTTEKAWVERLYADYFILESKTLQSGDILEVKKNSISLRTFSKNLRRSVSVKLPYKWKYTDVVEFDVVTNSLGYVSFGHEFHYSNGWTVSGGGGVFKGDTNTHHVWKNLGSCPDTYEGYTVYDYGLTFYIGYGNDITGETYAEISNVTINGKKYGFKE